MIISNGTVYTPDGPQANHTLRIQGDRIDDIVAPGAPPPGAPPAGKSLPPPGPALRLPVPIPA